MCSVSTSDSMLYYDIEILSSSLQRMRKYWRFVGCARD